MGFLGIILTDKLLSEAPPAVYFHDPVTVPDDYSDTLVNSGRRNRMSCRKELIEWLRRLEPQDANALFDDHELLAIRPILKIVERAGAMFLTHARCIVDRIVTRHCDEQFPDNIPFFLEVSRSLHRNTQEQQNVLNNALRVVFLKGAENMRDEIQDFNYLTEDMERALRALEENVRFLVAAASIEEGKIIGWVSKFAFLFLPVTLLATILTMSDDYIRFAILGGLGVPFVLVSMYLMFIWKQSNVDRLRF